MKTATSTDVAHDLLAILPLLGRLVAAEVRREAGDDTTMPQFRVLAYLAEQPLTLSALARQRRVSLQAMSDLVQMLVERGWIARTPDPQDRRQSLLALTTLGREHYLQVHERALERLVPLLDGLEPDERHAMHKAMQCVCVSPLG